MVYAKNAMQIPLPYQISSYPRTKKIPPEICCVSHHSLIDFPVNILRYEESFVKKTAKIYIDIQKTNATVQNLKIIGRT